MYGFSHQKPSPLRVGLKYRAGGGRIAADDCKSSENYPHPCVPPALFCVWPVGRRRGADVNDNQWFMQLFSTKGLIFNNYMLNIGGKLSCIKDFL